MAWNDANELVVASNGQVYFGPAESANLPKQGSDPTAALNTAFTGSGYTTEEGVSLSVGSEVTDIMAWQSRQAIRRDRQAQEIHATFVLQQWNESNLPFAFGGGEVVESGGVYTYVFPEADDALDERSLIIDAQDGDTNYRIVIPRGNVTEAVEASFRRTESAQLPITFKALEPSQGGPAAYLLTDSEAFVTGS